MTEVVLDTNALIMPFQFNINLDEEIERLVPNPDIYVPSSVTGELKKLKRKDALSLASKYNEVKVRKKGDRGVIEAVEKLDAVLVTNDKELKKKIRKKGYKVLFLRSKSYLELLGEPF